MPTIARVSFWLIVAVLAATIGAGAAQAQPTRPPPKIGVVDLDRLVRESPQAQKAKKNMAEQFRPAQEGAREGVERSSDRRWTG